MRHERESGSAVAVAMALGLIVVCLAGGFAWMQWRRSAAAELAAVQARMEAERARGQAKLQRMVVSLPRGTKQSDDDDENGAEDVEIAAIKSLLFTQQAAWNEADIETFMEGYWKSDELTFSSGGETRRSWQQTLEHYKKSYPTPEKMGQLDFSELEVELLAPDVAFVLGRWNLKDLANGNFTIILRKFSSGWAIIHDHSSQTPAQTPE